MTDLVGMTLVHFIWQGAAIALVLAAYALILTLRVRSELKRYAAARLTDTKEFLTTISDLSDRLDKPE